MSRTRLIKAAAPSPIFHERGVIRTVAGSLGSGGGGDAAAALGPQPVERGSAPDMSNEVWEAETRRREQAAGLLKTDAPIRVAQPSISDARWPPAGRIDIPAATEPADLSSLPARFTLDIERKSNGWWKITAPAVHVGLFVAHQDLEVALGDVPGALAAILQLDGVVPAVKRRRGKV